MQPIPANFFELEAQLQAELQVTCIEGSTSLSESRVPNTVVVLAFCTWQFEIGVIQDIEAFRAEFELSSLRKLEVLEERWIPVHVTRSCERVTPEGTGVSR
jgi:hypothetical protein